MDTSHEMKAWNGHRRNAVYICHYMCAYIGRRPKVSPLRKSWRSHHQPLILALSTTSCSTSSIRIFAWQNCFSIWVLGSSNKLGRWAKHFRTATKRGIPPIKGVTPLKGELYSWDFSAPSRREMPCARSPKSSELSRLVRRTPAWRCRGRTLGFG